jgi:hypothetical protein
MGHPVRVLTRTVGLGAATLAACLLAAAPPSVAETPPFFGSVGGALQVTGVGPNGPTSARYGGTGTATQLGAALMEGDISIVGPASCPNGFTATHRDTLTASDGSRVSMTISETSCPRPADPSTYDCTGTYTITGGTGRFASAAGSGEWAGSVAFSANGSATFSTSYSGTLSRP